MPDLTPEQAIRSAYNALEHLYGLATGALADIEIIAGDGTVSEGAALEKVREIIVEWHTELESMESVEDAEHALAVLTGAGTTQHHDEETAPAISDTPRKIEDPLELYRLGPGSIIRYVPAGEEEISITWAAQCGRGGYWIPVGAGMRVSPLRVASDSGSYYVVLDVADRRSDQEKLEEMFPTIREYLLREIPKILPDIARLGVRRSRRRNWDTVLNISIDADYAIDLQSLHCMVCDLLKRIGIGRTGAIDNYINIRREIRESASAGLR